MSLEDQRPAPTPRPCVEPGCDRAATDGDERCELHQVRLGARPSRSSTPSQAPRPVLPIVVESALDASVAVPPARAPRRRDLWFAMAGWAIGSGGFWGSLVLSSGLHLRGPLNIVFFVLVAAAGALATYGAGWFAWRTRSRVLAAVGAVLAFATGLPLVLGAVALLALLLSSVP